MTAATAARQSRTTAIGTGPLHQALEDARDLATLQAFCASQSCSPSEVSSDGKRIDMLRVFDLMRSRGYIVGTPIRPQTQLRKGSTTWLVDVTIPGGPSCTLGFYTPNTS